MTKSSFREALGLRGAAKAGSPAKSVSPAVDLLLLTERPIDRPIDFVRLLSGAGISVKRTRALLARLATKKPIAVGIPAAMVEKVVYGLKGLGMEVFPTSDQPVDVKKIREKQDLSQVEFAALYGLDADTLKNWEQGRNEPDTPARVLLRVIDADPDAVFSARAGVLKRFRDRNRVSLNQFIIVTRFEHVGVLARPVASTQGAVILQIVARNAPAGYRTSGGYSVPMHQEVSGTERLVGIPVLHPRREEVHA